MAYNGKMDQNNPDVAKMAKMALHVMQLRKRPYSLIARLIETLITSLEIKAGGDDVI